MNKILLLLIVFFTVKTCTTTPNISNDWANIGIDGVMTVKTDTFSFYQLDSLCAEEGMSVNLSTDWYYTYTKDYNTSAPLIKYLYIKEQTDSTEIIYTVFPYRDSLYIIEKRTVTP